MLLAISETAAILGLVLFLLGGLLQDFYVPAAASLIGHLALTPKRDVWETPKDPDRPIMFGW